MQSNQQTFDIYIITHLYNTFSIKLCHDVFNIKQQDKGAKSAYHYF